MEEKVYFKNSKGNKLCGILLTVSNDKAKPIVILVHGHCSNKNSNSLIQLKEFLEKKGISSFRIDLSGHGESKGSFEETTVSIAADDILSAIDYLKKQGYKKIGLIGSSFGGIASIMSASKSKDLFILALISPVCNYQDLYGWRKVLIQEWKNKGYRDYPTDNKMLKLNYSFYEDGLINDGYKAAPKIFAPTLIVHGDNDQEVPVEQSIKLSKLLPNCKLVIIKGANHKYTEKDHALKMLKAMSDFIISHV